MKISEAFAEYRHYEVAAMNYSASTFESYVNAEKAIITAIGNKDIVDLSVEDVHDVFLNLMNNHRCADTARSYISKLRVVVRYCRRHGLNTIDPEDIKIPRREKKVARFITVDEYRVFLRDISESRHGYKKLDRMRNILMVEMLFGTGLRIGELCALNRDSIKDRQFVVVGKSKEPRVCFVTHKIDNMIKEYLMLRTDNSRALFIDNISHQRMTPSSAQRIFRRVSLRSGIPSVTPHTLRHSFATRMIEEGVDIRYVAEMLGHQNLATTQKYTHIRDMKLQMVYDSVMEPHFLVENSKSAKVWY